MEQCAVCKKDFEPLKVPIELPEIWEIKPPQGAVCLPCLLGGMQDLLRFCDGMVSVVMKEIEVKRGE